MPGDVVTFSGPTAVGKNTILDKFWSLKSVVKRVAHTTRKPRDGEIHGVHYNFVSREEFFNRVSRGEFLEHAEVHGNLYGTTRLGLVEAVSSGRDVFFDLDIQGARQLKAKMPEVVSIFVLPPSFAELKRRLDGRKTEDEETKILRLRNAGEELRQAFDFDYFVVNDEVNKAVFEVQVLLGILCLGKIPPPERFRNIDHVYRLLIEMTAPL